MLNTISSLLGSLNRQCFVYCTLLFDWYISSFKRDHIPCIKWATHCVVPNWLPQLLTYGSRCSIRTTRYAVKCDLVGYIYYVLYHIRILFKGFARSPLLAFSQSYIKHDLRKNKIIVSFFANRLIFMS